MLCMYVGVCVHVGRRGALVEGRLPLGLSWEGGRLRKQRLEPRAQVTTVEDGQWPCFQSR